MTSIRIAFHSVALAGRIVLLSFLLMGAAGAGYSQTTEGRVQGPGVTIHYLTFGAGTPVLIINGGPGLDCEGFIPLARMLSGQNRTIVFDQRGTGGSVISRADSTTITMDLMADDMELLREHLHIDRWIVFGHSFGGMLASYYTALHPNRVSALVLSSSGGIDLQLLSGGFQERFNARLTAAERDSLAYWSDKIGKGDTTYAARWGQASAMANAYLVDKRYAPLIAERLTHSNLQINGLVFGDMQRIHFNCAPGLSRYKGPVLIIQGKEDIVDEKLAWKAHSVLKNSKVVLLENCSHYGWLDRKEEYLKEVGGFLAGK